jgi:hypothetical protein
MTKRFAFTLQDGHLLAKDEAVDAMYRSVVENRPGKYFSHTAQRSTWMD